jgi:hypothetical protein
MLVPQQIEASPTQLVQTRLTDARPNPSATVGHSRLFDAQQAKSHMSGNHQPALAPSKSAPWQPFRIAAGRRDDGKQWRSVGSEAELALEPGPQKIRHS